MELIVAFDVGDRRVGVAFSDPFGEYAMPSDTYFRTGDMKADAEALARLARERGAGKIVCGLPLEEDGAEGVQARKTRRFCQELERAAGIPVTFTDERYTTRAARGDLNQMGISAKKDKKKKSVDSLAAAYILENYLAETRREHMKEENNNYDDDSLIELVDDDGNTFRYEHLMTFEYKGEWYVAVTPELPPEEDEDDGDGEEDVAIFHVVGSEEDEHLETIEDDALMDELFDEFVRLYDADDEEE